MKRVVMLIAQNTFRDEEYEVPKRVLESKGAHVTTASRTAGKCIGKLGAVVEAQISLTESTQQDWDAVVFVGGAGAAEYFDDPEAHTLARKAASEGVVAAICIAPSILARAGILKGIEATAYPSQKDDLVAYGALWNDGPVVRRGNVVTGNGPDAAEEFGEEVAALLGL